MAEEERPPCTPVPQSSAASAAAAAAPLPAVLPGRALPMVLAGRSLAWSLPRLALPGPPSLTPWYCRRRASLGPRAVAGTEGRCGVARPCEVFGRLLLDALALWDSPPADVDAVPGGGLFPGVEVRYPVGVPPSARPPYDVRDGPALWLGGGVGTGPRGVAKPIVCWIGERLFGECCPWPCALPPPG